MTLKNLPTPWQVTKHCVPDSHRRSKAFVAGADIAAMAEMDAKQAEEFSALGHCVFAKLEQLPIPVLAAVNGLP